MNLSELKQALRAHSGTFLCVTRHGAGSEKSVPFRHEVMEPMGLDGVPDVGDLRSFYEVFGGIIFYLHEASGDAARYIAPVNAWPGLHQDFSAWLEGLDQAEREEYLPDWVATALVIGEEPHSGNYVLIPVAGDEAGGVYHFDHDGFEFSRHADSLTQYTRDLLDLDSRSLAYATTFMCFVEEGDQVQWHVKELRDNRGNHISCEA